jgi:hypothetical protein
MKEKENTMSEIAMYFGESNVRRRGIRSCTCISISHKELIKKGKT